MWVGGVCQTLGADVRLLVLLVFLVVLHWWCYHTEGQCGFGGVVEYM